MGGFGQVKKIHLFVSDGKLRTKSFLKEDFCYQENGVIIETGATLKGKILIGENSEIRSGAYLRAPS